MNHFRYSDSWEMSHKDEKTKKDLPENLISDIRLNGLLKELIEREKKTTTLRYKYNQLNWTELSQVKAFYSNEVEEDSITFEEENVIVISSKRKEDEEDKIKSIILRGMARILIYSEGTKKNEMLTEYIVDYIARKISNSVFEPTMKYYSNLENDYLEKIFKRLQNLNIDPIENLFNDRFEVIIDNYTKQGIGSIFNDAMNELWKKKNENIDYTSEFEFMVVEEIIANLTKNYSKTMENEEESICQYKKIMTKAKGAFAMYLLNILNQ